MFGVIKPIKKNKATAKIDRFDNLANPQNPCYII